MDLPQCSTARIVQLECWGARQGRMQLRKGCALSTARTDAQGAMGASRQSNGSVPPQNTPCQAPRGAKRECCFALRLPKPPAGSLDGLKARHGIVKVC